MDRLALPAVLLGVGVIVLALWLEGGHLSSLLNGPAVLIVVVGSFIATLVQSPWPRLRRWLVLCQWLVTPPRQDIDALLDNFQHWSQQCRNQGILALENASESYPEPFVRKGLQMLVDGATPEQVRELLESDLYLRQDSDYKAADIFQMMGGYAPTMGILGAVLGLIQAMGQLTNPEALGSGIATAFVATIYGVGFANLIFLPLGGRLHALIDQRSRYQEAAIVGLMSLGLGEHPAKVAMKLHSYQGD